ncbi:hypothetical protein [Glaciecola sp. KUL10]|uniref:hypothetical protein n=1 Tax=Glaciecola sp. (strain KUL10) TaxID=2161813 RepID=UPI000D78762B|nr:hypothetical protein [Glaciecola sp. KUL10]GBL05749.1 structural maintenance of chromosomes protein [Glaciecola sp. KUL10]
MNQFDRQWFEAESTKLDYQQGRLTAEQQLAFEEFILDKPELIDDLELNLAIKQHANLFEEQRATRSFWARFAMPFSAGALVSAVFVFSIFQFNFVTGHQHVHSIDQIIYLETMRSIRAEDTVIRQAANSGFIIAIYVDAQSPGSLTGVIKQRVDGNYNTISQIEDIKVSTSSEAFLHLETENLDSGSYQVELKNNKGETIVIQGFKLIIE